MITAVAARQNADKKTLKVLACHYFDKLDVDHGSFFYTVALLESAEKEHTLIDNTVSFEVEIPLWQIVY